MCFLRLGAIGILVCHLASLPPTFAQEPEAATTSTDVESGAAGENDVEAPATIAPIAPAEITSALTADSSQLRVIETGIRTKSEIVEVAIAYFGRGEVAAELRQSLATLSADTTRVRQLNDQQREWTLLAQRFQQWSQMVDQRWRDLQNNRDQLLAIQERWQLTGDALTEEEFPAELRQRADQILQRADELRGEVRNRIDEMAHVTQQLNDAKELANASLERLTDIIEQINQRLFRQDAPPLWRVGREDWRAIDVSSRQVAERLGSDIRTFTTTQWPQLLAHLFVLAALVIATLQARGASRSWPDDQPELRRTRELLARPYSLAVALAFIPCIFIYGVLPEAVRDAFYLVLLIALVRQSKALTRGSERVVLLGVLVLSLIYQFLYFSSAALLSRIALLLVELGVLAIVGFALYRLLANPSGTGGWRRVSLAFAGMVVLGCSVVAVIANVFGWVDFSQFLGEGTLLSCRGIVIMILLLRAWAAFWSAVLRQGPGRRLLSVRRNEDVYQRFGVGVLTIMLGLYWLQQTLRRFRLDSRIESGFAEAMETPLSWVLPEIGVGDVLRAALILAATIAIQRMLSFLLSEELFPRLRFGSSSAAIWATFIKYAIVACGLAMAAAALGFSATQLTVLFGALSVGIGFGLQNIVGNFVSGLILMLERPIKIGDIVEIGGIWGTVKRIGIRATVVQAFEGSEIVVPNGDLIAKEVKNWTLSATTARVEILLGTAYESDPREVLEIMLGTARAHEFVADEPEPFAMMYEFGESSLNFRMFCHTTIDKRGVVISDLHIGILEALSAAGIEIPFPQRDLNITSIDKSAVAFDRVTGVN